MQRLLARAGPHGPVVLVLASEGAAPSDVRAGLLPCKPPAVRLAARKRTTEEAKRVAKLAAKAAVRAC